MSLSLRAKLLLTFGLIVALTGGLAAYGLQAVSGATLLVTQVYDEALIGVGSARSAAGKLIAARDLMRRAETAPDGATADQIATLRRNVSEIGEDLKIVRERVHDAAVGRALDTADAARVDWLQSGLLVLAPPGGVAELPLPSVTLRKGAAASAAFEDVVDQVAAFGFQMRRTAIDTLRTSRRSMIFAASGIAAIGVLVAFLFSHLLSQPIRMATRVAENVASGNYSDRIQTQRRDELGRLLSSLAIMQDNLIGRSKQDRALMDRLQELSDSTFEGLVIHRGGTVLDANTAFCALVGLPLVQVKGMSLATFALTREDAMTGPCKVSALEATELAITIGNGEELPVEVRSRDISYADGPARVTAVRDIRERLAMEENTRFLAHHDALTGLPNRILLQARMAEDGREAAGQGALLLLDLDGFKAVNDTMGHAAGDVLLIEVARRLVAVAGPDELAARLGGDEFVLLCARADLHAVSALGERIRQAIEAPIDIAGRPCHVSSSIGIAIAGQTGGLDLVRAADMAMYSAKQAGGNRAVLFESSLYDRASLRFELEEDMRNALSGSDEFVLLYQPIFTVTSRTRRLAGFEALLRWRHPRHGWMSPGLFIPLAEKSGLMLPLGDWVLATALRQGRLLRQTYPDAKLIMNVNVSVLQLPRTGYCLSVADALAAEGYPAEALCLEVVESLLADADAAAVLADIRALGVQVAIDDFGIGFSSLSYLRRLPVDKVKMDRSFLEDIEGDNRGVGFVGAVIALAHAAGKPVVFEGIETQAQFDIARSTGADLVQGFFFAPPLSANAAMELAVQQRQLDDRHATQPLRST